MTLYEILSIATPIILIIFGGMISYILRTITSSIAGLEERLDKRIDKIDDRLGLMEKEFSHLKGEVYFIKGLIEGKNLAR